ncbi:hypothetical protein KCU70_g10064, partial [Aureobasidium melanogenum]
MGHQRSTLFLQSPSPPPQQIPYMSLTTALSYLRRPLSLASALPQSQQTLRNPLSPIFDLREPQAPHCIPLGDDEGSLRLLRVLSDRKPQRFTAPGDER